MKTLTMLLMLSLLVAFVRVGDDDAKHKTMLDTVSDDKTLALRWNLSGKLVEGGKQIAFEGLSFIHLNDDGKIAKEWITWDTYDHAAGGRAQDG